jgi:HAD superfamily hydrolase (TIGR01549 family)
MTVKAVLFDMFDTLMLIEKDHAFYSPAVKSMHTYLAQNGVQVSFAAFRDAYIKARDALYEEADQKMEEPHFDFRVKNALQILGYTTEAQSSLVQGATDAFCQEFMTYVRIDDNTTPVLKDLQAQYRLGIVSNFAIPECVTKLLAKHELSDFFDVVIVSAAVNKRKPNPEIFKIALEKLKLQPAQAVFVGDTVDADVKGGKEAGMKTVYLERRPQKELETINPDQIIKSLRELPAALKRF